MRVSRPVVAAALALLVLMGGVAVAVFSTGDGDPGPPSSTASTAMRADAATTTPEEALRQRVTYPHARALGLDLGAMRRVFSTQDGRMVGVLSGHGNRCLLYSNGSDVCATPRQIAQGRVFEVLNDCARSGTHSMTITGLAPPRVRRVRLLYSGGAPAVAAGVVDGAFKFNLTTPRARAPHPVVVVWIGAHGERVKSRDFPIGPVGFCHPGSGI